MNKEQWKDILGYEGLYQVSNLGRVKSLKFDKERILKNRTNSNGYLSVQLSKGNKIKSFLIHRLVANAFLPNPNNYSYVNHKDENKTNNCVDNLEWTSHESNCNFGTRNERISEQNINGKCSKEVIQCDLEGNEIARFPSVGEVQRQFGYLQGNISSCCREERKTAYKYKWRYA